VKIFARTLLSGLCVASLGFVGCDSDDPKTTTDTNTQTDTGSDTSTESDSSTSEDTSAGADTSTSEDTGPAEDTAQGNDATQSDASTGEDMTEPDTGSDATAGAGACDNSGDLAVIGNAETNPADKAAACGTSTACLPLALQQKVDEFETCVRDCMLDGDRPNFEFEVSEGCTECYVDSVRCTATQCLGQCATDPSSTGCVSCREDKGCTPSFYDCSGLPRN
jgi:hypothetical protein